MLPIRLGGKEQFRLDSGRNFLFNVGFWVDGSYGRRESPNSCYEWCLCGADTVVLLREDPLGTSHGGPGTTYRTCARTKYTLIMMIKII